MLRRNLELKARCPDLARARAAALNLGAAMSAFERQRDTFFHSREGRLKLREITRWRGDADPDATPVKDARRPGSHGVPAPRPPVRKVQPRRPGYHAPAATPPAVSPTPATTPAASGTTSGAN